MQKMFLEAHPGHSFSDAAGAELANRLAAFLVSTQVIFPLPGGIHLQVVEVNQDVFRVPTPPALPPATESVPAPEEAANGDGANHARHAAKRRGR